MQYCTLQSIQFRHKFITIFDPTKDTQESMCILSDGKVAYEFLALHDSIPDAQIAIYGRAYPLPGELYNTHLEK